MTSRPLTTQLPRTALTIVCLLALLAGPGCASYQLGSMLPPDIRSVHVPTFLNETGEPLIEVETTRAIIRAIQRDGSLLIAGEEDADAVLSVVLTDFHLQALGFDRERRAAANEYRMRIRAQLVLTRRETGAVIAQSPRIVGESTFIVTGDMTSAKQRAIPDAADDLAQLLISEIVEAW